MRPFKLVTGLACLAAVVLPLSAATAAVPRDREVLVYPLFPGPLPSGHPLPYRQVTPVDIRLMGAAEAGALDDVEAALAAGADPARRDMAGNLALHRAAERGHLAVVARLVAAGADVNALDRHQENLLSIAVRTHNPALTRLALQLGADPARVVSRYRGTALIHAARLGELDTLEQLLAAGAPVDYRNALGWTALHEAVLLGDGGDKYHAVVAALLKAGARADLPDRDGRRPLDYARERGYDALAALLQAATLQAARPF
ncbi:hypothetical protein EV683_13013 [Crenobacter luteus]|uniref:Uncharacterized protein n=1 Tax=Crenobacter luteus TaxID=1452487 RepID=A0A165FSF0_9NEIS|nr:ankyrin repeat domain-containing protein [Crenobacter luteus]KZE34065.1 hypothetical protein AVW16_07090 [Crenobacter luteus]TCP09129.1 hypothetical protein EV683_13013 [Crenobacter luteus]